jgi:hypothetical protein
MYQSSSDPVPASGAPTTGDATSATAPAAKLSEPARGFLNELVQAMQATAEHQREATNAEVESMTDAHVERVRARAAAEAEELRRMALADIDEINAWQEAEAVRLREEAERRIIARGEELDSYLMRHAAMVDGEVDQIEGAVTEYQTRLDLYFDRLTTEASPAEIARLADEIPEPPDLSKVGGEARAKIVAAIAAEDDESAFSPTAAGPGLVPVMAPANGSNGDPDASKGEANGANGTATTSNGEHSNPAIRLLRSLATLAAPVEAKPADATASAADISGVAVAEAPAEPAVDDATA